MSKILKGLLIGFLTVSSAGCVTVEKVVRERVDQDLSGNQGFIQGEGAAPAKTGQTTREYVDIKLEIPTWEEFKKELPKAKSKERRTTTPSRDRETGGNRGFITSSRGFEEQLPPVYKAKQAVSRPAELPVYEEADIEMPAEEIMVEPRTYKVKEGDSLSKLAKDFYGKASKWTLIYEANADRIKDPNRVKTGTVLTIPELEEGAESDYVK